MGLPTSPTPPPSPHLLELIAGGEGARWLLTWLVTTAIIIGKWAMSIRARLDRVEARAESTDKALGAVREDLHDTRHELRTDLDAARTELRRDLHDLKRYQLAIMSHLTIPTPPTKGHDVHEVPE